MNNLKTVSTLVFIIVCAANAMAFDLVTTATVEIVEGISIIQTTEMNFGQLADHDGAVTVATDPAVALGDPAFLVYDETGYTPGIFTCTSIAGASVDATFTDAADVAGLALSAFTVSVNGGANEADNTAIAQQTSDDTWNVGATLTVTALTAVIGVHNPGYTITLALN
jgi:Domain of unknown function (DUF4402)